MNLESKKYRVTLTDDERDLLRTLIERRSEKAVPVKRAYLLLAADEQGEKCWTDAKICETYHVGVRTVERLRQRFVEDGFDVAVWGKKRDVFKDKTLDGKVEAHLVALRCSSPPSGYAKWSLRLLAERMVILEYTEHISHESVRQVLKKTSSTPGT
jgi:hypothetical protein